MNLDLCRLWKMNMLQQCVYLGGMKRRTTWGFDSCSLMVQSAVAPTQQNVNQIWQFQPNKMWSKPDVSDQREFWWDWDPSGGGGMGGHHSQGRQVLLVLALVFLFVLVLIFIPVLVHALVFVIVLTLHLTSFYCHCLCHSMSSSSCVSSSSSIHRHWLKWALCRPANILQWLKVPPVAGDRCLIMDGHSIHHYLKSSS